jgi:hypothetical protein
MNFVNIKEQQLAYSDVESESELGAKRARTAEDKSSLVTVTTGEMRVLFVVTLRL